MGADDAGNCVHDFATVEVDLDGAGARLVHECRRCGLVAYEASASD